MSEEELPTSLGAVLTSAIGYWEPRRVLYNGALVIVVVAMFTAGLPVSMRVLAVDWLLSLFVLAVLANVAYCAAYIPDILLQLSSYRGAWLRIRWVLLAVGILFGSCLAYFFVAGPFGFQAGNG